MQYLALIPLIFGAFADDDEWQTFTPKDDQFSVSFPGKPEVETKQTSLGTTLTNVTYEHDELVMALSYGECGLKRMPSDADKENFLNGFTQSNTQGQFLGEMRIAYGIHPGRDALRRVDDGQFVRIRVYLINSRSYALMVLARDRAAVSSPAAEKFLQSFSMPVALQQQAAPTKPMSNTQAIIGAVVAIALIIIAFKVLTDRKSEKPQPAEQSKASGSGSWRTGLGVLLLFFALVGCVGLPAQLPGAFQAASTGATPKLGEACGALLMTVLCLAAGIKLIRQDRTSSADPVVTRESTPGREGLGVFLIFLGIVLGCVGAPVALGYVGLPGVIGVVVVVPALST